MSTKREAPSDTFKLQLHSVPQGQLSDRNDDSSSVSSSIPEMSKLEELQLKRSFQAIQKPETPPPTQEEDFTGRSNPLFQDDDGTKITTEKDESDSDEERFRRARRSGLVSSQQSSFTEVHPRNSMSPSSEMEEQFDSVTNPSYTAQWDELTTPTESSVHIVQQYTRERTPDATASRGQLVVGRIGSDKPAINTPNLGYTMRDQIKDMLQQPSASTSFMEHTTPTSPLEHTTPTSPLRKTTRDEIRNYFTEGAARQPAPRYSQREVERPHRIEDTDKDDDDEKRGPCLPRCAVVGVFLAILFGSIVALIVLVDENRKQEKKFGSVFPDPITFQECANIKLNLTDVFRIKCIFDFSHPQHREVQNVRTVTIFMPNGTAMDGSTGFIKGYWNSSEITATCATIGTYSVGFGDKHVFMLNVTLDEPTIEASIEQRFFNDTRGSSHFITNCTVYGDCTNYQANFVGVSSNSQDILTENITCTSEQSNLEGIRLQCVTTIPDSTARRYTGLKCQVSADGTVQKEKNIDLPRCGINCSTGKINCTEGAEDRRQIDQCDLSILINDCFYPGRTFHSYCSPETNQCSCVLNWCELVSQTTQTEVDNHPGKLLCGPDFVPFNFTASPPTTTTTTITTTEVTSP